MVTVLALLVAEEDDEKEEEEVVVVVVVVVVVLDTSILGSKYEVVCDLRLSSKDSAMECKRVR